VIIHRKSPALSAGHSGSVPVDLDQNEGEPSLAFDLMMGQL
jgi:hypothetical protein